ncbi:MAG: DUF1330 domain-containing protein [Pedobacter sp.]|nr:MAG: DUF1330 domain-containing protein [Pedobacter sp.]
MIYITQLIYIKPGKEAIFDQFESVALPLIAKYNGKLLLRVRPGDDAFIESSIEEPYEIHFVQFNEDDNLKAFMLDEERKQFLHLKEEAIRSVLLVKGQKL